MQVFVNTNVNITSYKSCLYLISYFDTKYWVSSTFKDETCLFLQIGFLFNVNTPDLMEQHLETPFSRIQNSAIDKACNYFQWYIYISTSGFNNHVPFLRCAIFTSFLYWASIAGRCVHLYSMLWYTKPLLMSFPFFNISKALLS